MNCLAVIDKCLSPFISSALEGKLAPAIAAWVQISLDDSCGPRCRKALLAVPSQGTTASAETGLKIEVNFRPRRPICRKFRRCKQPKATACDDSGRTSINCGTYLGQVPTIPAHSGKDCDMWLHLSGSWRTGRSATKTSVQLGGIHESIRIGASGNNRQLFHDSPGHGE
jgi:hypothetical protein